MKMKIKTKQNKKLIISVDYVFACVCVAIQNIYIHSWYVYDKTFDPILQIQIITKFCRGQGIFFSTQYTTI